MTAAARWVRMFRRHLSRHLRERYDLGVAYDPVRSHADLLANTDKVIEKVRAERNLKPKK